MGAADFCVDMFCTEHPQWLGDREEEGVRMRTGELYVELFYNELSAI